jgi:hypothetical protein
MALNLETTASANGKLMVAVVTSRTNLRLSLFCGIFWAYTATFPSLAEPGGARGRQLANER